MLAKALSGGLIPGAAVLLSDAIWNPVYSSHPGMFGQVVVMRLFRDHGILTQMCGNNFMVLKVAPPLVIDENHVDEFVRATSSVVQLMHASSSFWTEAIGLARRAINV